MYRQGGGIDDILLEPLFIYQYIDILNIESSLPISGWFISSEKENPILHTTLDMLLFYWFNNDVKIDYFLFHMLIGLASKKYPKEWSLMPKFSNVPPHIMQFEWLTPYNQTRFEQITRMSNFHKLTYKLPETITKDSIKGTIYEHILKTFR